MLSLRRRRRQGPTLASRLVGAADDCRLPVVRRLEARLDMRRIRLDFWFVVLGATPVPGVSGMALEWFIKLWPSELQLVLRETMDSGS